MVKEKKKSNKSETQQQNPETEERTRLKTIAHKSQIISQTPANAFSSLTPSKTLIKHHGKDIVKKSQRKTRYLFSFSGLLAPISGGKIGELSQLRSKNPILYLEFPQGRMKLFGTIVFPKNRYLTLQFSRGGRNVVCEDCFDTMVVFSEGYWVGKKDENPDEARLEIPEELYEKKQSEFDFQGGAGGTAMQNNFVRKTVAKTTNEESSSDLALDDMETESPERQVNFKDVEYATPVRHSERTSGKKFKFTEVSSGDDSAESVSDMPAKASDEANDEAAENAQNLVLSETAVKVRNSEDVQPSTVQVPPPSMLSAGEKKSSRSSFVQPTISTLFKKIEQKSTAEEVVKEVPNKASKKIALPSSSKSKNKSVKTQMVPEAAELLTETSISQVRKEGTRTSRQKGKADVTEVENDTEDDIEDLSSTSEVGDDSDDDWAA